MFDYNGGCSLFSRQVDTPVAGCGPDSPLPRLAFDGNGDIHGGRRAGREEAREGGRRAPEAYLKPAPAPTRTYTGPGIYRAVSGWAAALPCW
ncbi:MAG: hypothetical protein FJ149_12825 [Euryarchaeota archaeon]|nr:hypothetical protein [Euryarchaeota archaeon]